MIYGVVAGVLVGVPLFAITVGLIGQPPAPWDVAIGYLTMLIALSAVFAAVKRQRDEAQGGVIGFWPALGLGLAVSLIAGLFYVAAWEAALAVTHMDFGGDYARAMIARARARGETGAALARAAAEAEAFRRHYADPLYRLPATFAEIFPVGVLVSLVSAGLLRNSRFLPTRR
jgi:hypothetical protein